MKILKYISYIWCFLCLAVAFTSMSEGTYFVIQAILFGAVPVIVIDKLAKMKKK